MGGWEKKNDSKVLAYQDIGSMLFEVSGKHLNQGPHTLVGNKPKPTVLLSSLTNGQNSRILALQSPRIFFNSCYYGGSANVQIVLFCLNLMVSCPKLHRLQFLSGILKFCTYFIKNSVTSV